MAAPQLTPFTAAPDRQTDTPAQFSANATAFVDHQANVFLPEVNVLSTAVNGYAEAALVSETNSAINAITAAGAIVSVSSTSTTSVTIGLGALTWTTQTGLGYVAGQSVRISDASDPVNSHLIGTVTNYITGTGQLDVTVSIAVGAGALADWIIVITTEPYTIVPNTFEASGAVGSGDSVILNADGTVSVVDGLIREFKSDNPITGYRADNRYFSMINAAGDTVLAAYYDGVLLQQVVVAGVITGESIAWGTPVEFDSNGTNGNYGMWIAEDTDSGSFLISHYRANSVYGTGFTVAGSVITTGTSVEVMPTVISNSWTCCAYDPDNSGTFIVLGSSSPNNQTRALIVGLSGTTVTAISSPSNVTDFTGHTGQMAIAYDSIQNKFLTLGAYSGAGIATINVITSNGTTITRGIDINTNLRGAGLYLAFMPDSGKFIAYGSSIDATLSEFEIITIDSGVGVLTWTWGARITGLGRGYFIAGGDSYGLAYAGSGKFYYTTFDGIGYAEIDTSDFLSIEFSALVKPNVNMDTNSSLFYSPVNFNAGMFWANTISSDLPNVTFYNAGSTNVTPTNFLGFSEGDYIDAELAEIVTFAGIAGAQTGLTVNGEYYIQEDGSTDTTPNPLVTVLAGRAVSATSLIVKEPSA